MSKDNLRVVQGLFLMSMAFFFSLLALKTLIKGNFHLALIPLAIGVTITLIVSKSFFGKFFP